MRRYSIRSSNGNLALPLILIVLCLVSAIGWQWKLLQLDALTLHLVNLDEIKNRTADIKLGQTLDSWIATGSPTPGTIAPLSYPGWTAIRLTEDAPSGSPPVARAMIIRNRREFRQLPRWAALLHSSDTTLINCPTIGDSLISQPFTNRNHCDFADYHLLGNSVVAGNLRANQLTVELLQDNLRIVILGKLEVEHLSLVESTVESTDDTPVKEIEIITIGAISIGEISTNSSAKNPLMLRIFAARGAILLSEPTASVRCASAAALRMSLESDIAIQVGNDRLSGPFVGCPRTYPAAFWKRLKIVGYQ